MAAAAAQRILGKIIHRNAIVSESMIITSMKLAVMNSTRNLNRETSIRVMIRTSDKAAESTGRRNSASQKKLSRLQVRMKARRGTSSNSLTAITASAARCRAARPAMSSRRRNAGAGLAGAGGAAGRGSQNRGENMTTLTRARQRSADRTHAGTMRLFGARVTKPYYFLHFKPVRVARRATRAKELLDQLVGAGEEIVRQIEPERLGGIEIDDQLDLG